MIALMFSNSALECLSELITATPLVISELTVATNSSLLSIEIVYASGVQLIKSDTKFYVVKAYKKNGVDTLYIPVIH